MMLEKLGENLDRSLYALNVPRFESFKPVDHLPTKHFLCLLAADFTSASDGEIIALANSLLEFGASYFVCWGAGCERAHDLIDDLTLLVEPPVPDDSIIMSTWHANETLSEALFFLLCNAWPDSAYVDSTGSLIAVSVGGGAIATEIREALSEPEQFIAKVST